MPVHLFTFHGYRTWMPDHPDGYSRKGEGTFAPDDEMNANYDARSKFPEITFDEARQRIVVDACSEVCRNLGIALYYAVCVNTHCHVLVGWRGDRVWTILHDRMKRVVAMKLAKAEGVSGRRWLVLRRSGEAVIEPKHFAHLMTEYLPGHFGYTSFDPKAMEDARVYTRGHDGSEP